MEISAEIWYGSLKREKGGTMNIAEVRPRLYLIGLEQKIEKFGLFIGSWVYDGKEKFLVDVGPRASVDQLVEGLQSLKIGKLDFIFLTHIHIDHAGGTGVLLERFPEARVVCHESGIPHLAHPEKLWEGSKKVLGDLALKYGEIAPVPEQRMVAPDAFKREGFQVIRTPGHAAHHLSFLFQDYLFAGEAGGVYVGLKNRDYLRPATPPKFILEEAVGSIDRLLEVGPREICYAHYGIHPDAVGMLRRYRNQLHLWRDVIAQQMGPSGPVSLDDLVSRCIPVLVERDELFKPYKDLTGGDKERETYFVRNGIQGISEYVASQSR
jgi:glyoxylase-like metal-dependent hydrolase (beta-lactamase superfamily II)